MTGLSIRSDDDRVTAALREMATLVAASGGAMHPGAVLVCEQGDLQVRCEAVGGDQRPLFVLPESLLIPISGLAFTSQQGRLRYSAEPHVLSSDQYALLDVMVEVYDATAKLAWAERELPSLALPSGSPLAEALRRTFPQWQTDEDVAARFLHTRVLGTGPGAPAGPSVLMPLVDYLNHHRAGAGFNRTDGWLRIAVKQHVVGGECFATYGNRRDAMDLALTYGFASTDVPFARSVPTAVDVPGLGRLTVARSKPTAKAALDPPQVSVDGDHTRFSHLVFHRNHPDRWRANVDLAVRAGVLARSGSDGQARAAADAARATLVEVNLAALAAIEQAGADMPGNAAAATIASAARSQAAVVAASAC